MTASYDAFGFRIERSRFLIESARIDPSQARPRRRASASLGPGVRAISDRLVDRQREGEFLELDALALCTAQRLLDDVATDRRSPEEALFFAARCTNVPSDPRALRRLALIRNVSAVIARRFSEPIALRDVAADLGLSPAYLTDTIRVATGRPVGQWIIERRLLEARSLLERTDLAVGDVAALCGIPDASYFCRAFRRRVGAAPGVWRAKRRCAAARENRAPHALLAVLDELARATTREAVEQRAAQGIVDMLDMNYAHAARRDRATGVWRTMARESHLVRRFHESSEYLPSVLVGNTYVLDALSTCDSGQGRQISAAGFETFVAVPLFVDGECVGGLGAFERRSRIVTHEELRVIETIAACAALRLTALASAERDERLARDWFSTEKFDTRPAFASG